MGQAQTAFAERRRTPQQARAWLQQGPPLSELREAYPLEWERVARELATVAARGPDGVTAYLAKLSTPAPVVRGGREAATLGVQVRRVMAATALSQLAVAAASGVGEGTVRFNLVNGYVAQKLLFERDLERKPVSMFWFRLLWPLVGQRRLLMPLVQEKGIYCFYSKQLIHKLAALIGDRRCLEIGAGDGTLSRFLSDAGIPVIATDDYSWQRYVRYPATIQRQDARTALRVHRPDVVVCSWPPAWNTFERFVFDTPSVQVYIAINSRSEYGSGNRSDYASQRNFELFEHPTLSRLVLPPELDPVVHIFSRTTDGEGESPNLRRTVR